MGCIVSCFFPVLYIPRNYWPQLCKLSNLEIHFWKPSIFLLFPEGPYGIFAGRDASRGLATFCLDKDALRDEYDDLSDLNAVQMESVREWEMQFKGNFSNLTNYGLPVQGKQSTQQIGIWGGF